MKIKVEIEVTKEGYELISGLSKFIAISKKEIDDNGGYDTMDDLPGIGIAFKDHVLPALEGSTKISDEIKEDKTAFMRGVTIGILELVEVFGAKKEEKAEA